MGPGPDDQGPLAQPSTVTGVLRSVAPADGQLFARLGGVIVLTGDELGGTSVSVRLANRRLPVTVTAPATSVTDSSVQVTLPSDPAAFSGRHWTAPRP